MSSFTRRRLAATGASLAALAALVVLLFPLYAVVVASFETNSELFGASHYSFFPSRFTLSNYRVVLRHPPDPRLNGPSHLPALSHT
jgi:ABC-type glycerol-3-phosphate transport system permease component